MLRGALAAAAICALALGGCGGPVVSPAVPPASPTAPGSGPVESPTPTPELTLPPGGPTATPASTPSGSPAVGPNLTGMLTCAGSDVAFPTEVLRLLPNAEAGRGEAAAALRALLASPQGAELHYPPSGWRLAVEAPVSLTFIAEGPDGWVVATLARSAAGSWEFFEGGACNLAVKLPAGIGFATWRLDPSGPTDPAATSVVVLATERACASGQAPTGRVLPPVVLVAPDAITIAIEVRIAPGAQDCPGNPEVQVTVPLGEPLGSRHLFDGSSFPAVERR